MNERELKAERYHQLIALAREVGGQPIIRYGAGECGTQFSYEGLHIWYSIPGMAADGFLRSHRLTLEGTELQEFENLFSPLC